MSYSLEADETLTEGLKRIAREELDDALAHLRDESGEPEDERVHEARKSLKKVRAVLRLVRKEIGEDVYKRENVALRDAGRRLSPVRDAQVLVETASKLRERGGESVAKRDFDKVIAALTDRQDRTRRRVLGDGEAFAEVAETVAAARGRIDGWPIDRTDSEAFESSLRKTYKRGREAFEEAYEAGTVEAFHEWRKRTKYHWYHTRLLEPAAEAEIGVVVDATDQLSDLMGLDHDYAVLVETIERLGSRGAPAEGRRRIIAMIERERLELERRSLPLGHRVFDEKPKGRASQIATLFDGWRANLDASELPWLGRGDFERARELLATKATATAAEARKLRGELRDMGLRISELEPLVLNGGGEFGPEHLEELVGRGLIGVGDATELRGLGPIDRLRRTDVDAGPNEASGLCPITDRDFLSERGWELGFWAVLDDTTAAEGVVAAGHARGESTEIEWESFKPDFDPGDAPPETDDGEDCLLLDGWVYAFGSHYGSKEGPLELERQFIARFRESDAGADPVPMEIAATEFRLHRLINDALADSDLELMGLEEEVIEALVGQAIANGGEEAAGWVAQLHPDDQPINIEGCAVRARSDDTSILVGLRVPVTAEGNPIIVELSGLDCLFADEPNMPEVRGLWVLEGIGHPSAPAGVRGMTERPGGGFDILTGNLDSVDKGSVLIEHHPEAGVSRSAHHHFEIPARRRQGGLATELVREFPGCDRVEGIALDPLGRPFYVIDEDERIHLLYAEVD